ncbi:hypothetical protein DMA11_01795 [Marinilabiliaceae bacterium JC017]|nr:hypothetical protein DMA11_01795 [Marinilabiliaceae bacterium JC017]
MEERDKKYYRFITHHEYEKVVYGETPESWVEKRIYNGEYEITKEDEKSPYILYIDDKYMVKDETSSAQVGFRVWFIGALLMILPFAVEAIYADHPISEFHWFGFVAFFAIVFLSAFLGYYSFFHPPYIYNRLDGTVTMPLMYGKGSCTMEFSKLKYGLSTSRMGSTSLTLVLPKPRTWGRDMGGSSPQTVISLYTWYMDKNRPLPRGKAFDPYRERDFQRRKAEGFPEPLYPSFIHTPEHTPEHEAERAASQRTNIETFYRETGSEWYSPEKHGTWEIAKMIYSDTDITPQAYIVLRYEFEDGRIIYARADQYGYIDRPSKTEKFNVEIVKDKEKQVTFLDKVMDLIT